MAEKTKTEDTPATREQGENESQANDPTLSRQAQFSTYSDSTPKDDTSAANPPPGRQTKQTLGTPTEGPTVQGQGTKDNG
jgi:hypothetical protein